MQIYVGISPDTHKDELIIVDVFLYMEYPR
jgi:hypothetical protein